MAIVAQWSGDGLTDGTVVTTATAGTGDTPFSQVNGSGGNVLVRNSGVRPMRLEFPALTSQTKFLTWTSGVVGLRTVYAVRCYVELTNYGSLSSTIFRLQTGATEVWRVDVAGTGGSPPGEVRLRGTAGALLDDSGTLGLALNTVYRFEGVVSAGSVTLKVYTGDSMTVWDTLTGTVATTVDRFDIGPSGSTTSAIQYFDDIAIADTASEIGPVAPSGPTVSVWNGTSEVPATIQGVWNGTTVVSGSFDEVV